MADTTTAVSPLRRRMIDDMMLRNLSPATQRSYIHAVNEMLLDVGPAPWRRLLVRPETTIDELHRLVQRCMDWDERAWHVFRVHGGLRILLCPAFA